MSSAIPLVSSARYRAAQARLEQLSAPAILLSPDYRVLACNPAYELHYGKSVRLGIDTCHQISHGYDTPCDRQGETCPLRAALRSGHAERVFHIHHHETGPEHVDVELQPLHDEEDRVWGFIEVIQPIEEASPHAAGQFVGRSPAFVEMLSWLARAAPTEVPVLLLGESGTGKELCARALHARSRRRERPFVPVECSGLSEHLFESELFGHVKGAFTGAYARKVGLVEAAQGGTLFLDEVGDIPLGLQVKLLRLLESRTYRRVGEVEAHRADFRLVCATHRDLWQMVRAGTFREDLFYRINTFPVRVPPLRERQADLGLLAASLLRPHKKTLTPAALASLEAHPFPGNIRELKNLLERACILSDTDHIEASALWWQAGMPSIQDDVAGQAAPETARPEAAFVSELCPLDDMVTRYVAWAETQVPADRAQLAARLRVSERTLYRHLQKARALNPEP